MVKRKPSFRVLSFPQTYKIATVDENWDQTLAEFMDFCDLRGKPCFISLYSFKKASNWAVDRETAIVDRIAFDIDSDAHKMGNEDPLKQLRKLQDWLDGAGMDYNITFSGNDGFHVLLLFPAMDLKHPYDTVRELYKRFAEITNVNIDKGAMLGTQQKFRVENSKHQRTGFYAVPLTKEQARTLDMPAIRRLAKSPQPRTEWCEPKHNSLLVEVCEKYDNFDFTWGVEIPGGTRGYDGFLPQVPLRPCTRMMMERGLNGWYAMNIVSWEMIAAGYKDADIHAWSQQIGGSKYDRSLTQYHIDKLRPKIQSGDLFIHGCNTIKSLGFCVNEMATGLDDCRDAEKKRHLDELRANMNSNSSV